MASARRAGYVALAAIVGGALAAFVTGCGAAVARPPHPLVPSSATTPSASVELRRLISPSDLPAGLVLTEELAPRLDWRSAQDDPWGWVESYSATFAALPDRVSGTASGAHGVSEITISLNSYLDTARALSTFQEWRSLVPVTYAPVAVGRWRQVTWSRDAAISVYSSTRSRGARLGLVGFCAGQVMGSVRVAMGASAATDGTEGPGDLAGPADAGPLLVALDVARHVADALHARMR